MPANKEKFKSDISSAFKKLSSSEDVDVAGEEFAKTLSDLIDNYIRTFDVVVNAGIPVQVGTTGTGVTTTIGKGSLK